MAPDHNRANVDQLRHDIDQGRTGDKVRFPDPAAAPLGTDEEAAGTPIDPRIVAEVRDREVTQPPPRDSQRSPVSGDWGVTIWVAIVVVTFTVLLIGIVTSS